MKSITFFCIRSAAQRIIPTNVLIGVGAIAYLSLQVGGLESPGRGGIALFAKFDEVADLKARAPVQLAGVTVGQVTGIKLDSDYRARVDMLVEPHVELPVDSSASVVNRGRGCRSPSSRRATSPASGRNRAKIF